MSELALHGGPQAAGAFECPAWPRLTDEARENVLSCLEGGRWCRLYDGSWAERFEDAFAAVHDAEHAVAVANGTVAIELALRSCDLQPGEEVLVPAYTFIATASAVACMGAVPRFVDVDPDTQNVDPDSLREHVTDRTAGVIGVHFGGRPFDLDAVRAITDEHDLFLVEDAAHAHGSAWRGQRVGAVGDAGTFSFQETKALAGGEGGILLTDDDVLAERARLLHNIGRRQRAVTYRHHVVSSNYRLAEVQAALLLGQLEAMPAETDRRRRGASVLRERLADVPGVLLPPTDDHITERGYVSFGVRVDTETVGASRDRFLEALRAEGVPASDGYGMPLYRQPAFHRERLAQLLPRGVEVPRYRNRHLPGAEEVCRTVVSLPHEVLLAEEDGLHSVADAVEKAATGL